MVCAICREGIGKEHVAREMMMGTRKEFSYWECRQCGCIQIMQVPDDLADYYADGYYSFAIHYSGWKKWYYRAHLRAPRLVSKLRRCPVDVASVFAAKPQARARILDVGCGGGRLASILRGVGFDAYGIDPFLKQERGFLRKASLEEVEGGWDIIVFNHSLEHMHDQIDALRAARKRLAAGGICIVRIPLATWAWEHYGKDWVQLDAPRHLVIHTPRSFRLAAEAAGFEEMRVVFDSTDFQFRGSELYKRNFSLQDDRRHGLFSRKELRGFFECAERLNSEQKGDQATFYLKPKQVAEAVL